MNADQRGMTAQYAAMKRDLVRKRNDDRRALEAQRKQEKLDAENNHKQAVKDLQNWYDEQIQMSRENEQETPDDATRAELRAFHMQYSADRRQIVRDRNDRKKSLEAGRKDFVLELERRHKERVAALDAQFNQEYSDMESREKANVASLAS